MLEQHYGAVEEDVLLPGSVNESVPVDTPREDPLETLERVKREALEKSRLEELEEPPELEFTRESSEEGSVGPALASLVEGETLMPGGAEGDVYFARELLLNSLEGRRLDLVVISSKEGMTSESMTPIPHLFPDRNSQRPRAFRWAPPSLKEPLGGRHQVEGTKRIVIISARVHPGETPASHVWLGLVAFLLSADPRARELRRRYVFWMVPMLNPDGVSKGHWRADTLGRNLNRCYEAPTIEEHPTIYAIDKLLAQASATGALAMYLDLHAHCNTRGCFLYGNALEVRPDI